MLRCRKCSYLSDDGETFERCPNCGTLVHAHEPEPVLPVALGTVWRRGAGEPAGAESRDPDAAVPEDRSKGAGAAGPGDRSMGAGVAGLGDRSTGVGAAGPGAALAPSVAAITGLPRAAVPGTRPAGAARRGTGFFTAVPDAPARPALFAPPRSPEAASKDRRDAPGAAPVVAAAAAPAQTVTASRGGASETSRVATVAPAPAQLEASRVATDAEPASAPATVEASRTAVSPGLEVGGADGATAVLVASAASGVRDVEGEHDDLPAPVASTRPFTLPKIVRRISVPAATAATTELDNSAELDLPQLAAMTNLPPAIETVVASPRPPGSTRPDDVDLDLDDLHGEPSQPPIAPTPPSSPDASPAPSANRSSLRPTMRPRPRRLAPHALQPPPPAIAYVGLLGLALGLLGLWWFYFTRGPGLGADSSVQPARTDMSRATWSEGYLEAQAALLDADRVPDYLAALAEAEAQGDRLGRAEAALCMHLRYGPDPVRRSAAAVWRTQAAPDDPRAARVAGLAALADGDLTGAERLLAGEDDARARLYRALVAERRGDERSAQREAALALHERPGDVAAALVLATATLAARRDAPLEPLQDAAAAHPDHPQYQRALLRALLERGRLAAARRLADLPQRVAGASTVHQARLVLLRAEVAAATGEFSKARWVSDEAVHLAPADPATQLARVRLLLTAGDLGRVQQELAPLLRNAPIDPETSALQAELAIAAGNESTAVRAIERLAAAEGDRGRVAVLRGRVHVMRGRMDEAAAAFTAALADDPTDVPAAIALAELRTRAGADDPLASITRAAALLREDPRAPVRPGLRALALAHANLLVETGRKDQAVAVLDAALAVDPDDNAAQLRRGVLALEQGRGAAGRADLTAVFVRTGGYPGLVAPLGRLYLRDGDLAGLAELVQPYAADPDAPDDVVLMNALLRLAQGDRDAADSHVDKVLQRNPGSWEAHLVKARVLYERDRNSDAAAQIRLARPRSPDAEVELWTGKIAERGGKIHEAVSAYRRARQQDPGLLEAGFLLGRALLAQGLAREAVAELQTVTRAAEVLPGAHLALGLALREREQLPEALQSFTHAIDHDPNPDEALYWAGRTAVELGRHAEAVPQLGRAVALAGAGTSWLPDAQLWLGRALHHLGRRAEARAAFTVYLQQAGEKAPARAEVEKLLRER